MSEMIERVARAIHGDAPLWEDCKFARYDQAIAAIKAMREPTEAQIRAVDKACHEHWPNARQMAIAMQHALIDAALSDTEGAISAESPER